LSHTLDPFLATQRPQYAAVHAAAGQLFNLRLVWHAPVIMLPRGDTTKRQQTCSDLSVVDPWWSPRVRIPYEVDCVSWGLCIATPERKIALDLSRII
jgi:hypothetical protein